MHRAGRYRPCRGALESTWLCLKTRSLTSSRERTRSADARDIYHVGGNRDRQDAGHSDPVPSTDVRGPSGPRHQAGGFRLLARRSGQRSGLDPAKPRPDAHAAIDRGDRPLAVRGAAFAPPGGSKGRADDHVSTTSPPFAGNRAAESDGLLLIEGAGGVMAPIDDTHTGLDLIGPAGASGHPGDRQLPGCAQPHVDRACRHSRAWHRRAGDRRLRIGSTAWDWPTRSKACVNLPEPMFRCLLCRD